MLAELAAETESAGFDGVFLWDHVARPKEPGLAVGDAWIGLAAIAAATSRVVLGPRVTPLSRRRPQDLARETVALDRERSYTTTDPPTGSTDCDSCPGRYSASASRSGWPPNP